MTTPDPPPQFLEAYRLFLDGRPEEALAALPPGEGLEPQASSTRWRLRGMLHQHAGEYAEAEAAYARAAAAVPVSSLRFGEARFASAVLFGLQGYRDDAVGAYLDARERLREHRRYVHLALVNYNLGWSLTQLMRLDLAADAFERDLLSTERGEARQHAGLLHYGRAHLWILTGEYDRAAGSLAWASGVEASVDVRVRIAHLQAQLVWLQTGRAAAAGLVRTLQATGSAGAGRLARASVELSADILSGDVRALDEASRRAEHSVRVRAGLHLAEIALHEGDENAAARRLESVLSTRPLPGQLQFEALFLRDLYAWARASGRPLPEEPPTPPRTVRVHLYGHPRLVVADRPVRLDLTPEAAAIACRLCEVGEEQSDTLCRYVLGRSGRPGRAVLARAIRRLRLAFGTLDCVSVEHDTVRLNPLWEWRASEGAGSVAFSELDSDYARDVELRRPLRGDTPV
ncbi:hypothetical protein QR90_08645 [Deinococcus radiopugnans]|uniref:Tetratricopeptide repeat-containing protein n=1 Tax=Deinococcus radiopugnans TaxID=57497 RepID=A0A0A7KG81_9DEIO|nr:hypothetical protein [Deinococcus radiopugnans]AIZ45156.1 hypothetical protein QR90_08645 [Deinococcus radiopugnans]